MNPAGRDIVAIKDDMHTKWFELKRSKRSDQSYSFLKKSTYDEILSLGKKALNTLIEADPNSQFINRIQKPLDEVEWKSYTIEDIAHIGAPPVIFYVLTPERGQEVITQDINRLANEIHHAGMSLLNFDKGYCGCWIEESIDNISSINTGVLKYCEGALSKGERPAQILPPGDILEHSVGSAENHRNTIKFVPTEKGYDIDMEYMESGDLSWRDRREGVISFIRKKGGTCTTADFSSRCKIEDVSEEDILDIALVISQLPDIDLADPDCIPLAFELIRRQADQLKTIEPKEVIWESPWTRARNIEEMEDCESGHYEEMRTRARKATLYDRLSGSIDSLDRDIQWGIGKSETEPCTRKPYNILKEGAAQCVWMRDYCKQIKTETDGAYDWCLTLSDLREAEVKEAAKELVNRCPPEGIILGLEAANRPFDEVREICQLADNLDCLDIIRQVDARAEAGIKPAKLELKMREE